MSDTLEVDGLVVGPNMVRHWLDELESLRAALAREKEARERAEALAAKWEAEAVRFGIVAIGSTIEGSREAATRLHHDRSERAAELRAALAGSSGGAR